MGVCGDSKESYLGVLHDIAAVSLEIYTSMTYFDKPNTYTNRIRDIRLNSRNLYVPKSEERIWGLLKEYMESDDVIQNVVGPGLIWTALCVNTHPLTKPIPSSASSPVHTYMCKNIFPTKDDVESIYLGNFCADPLMEENEMLASLSQKFISIMRDVGVLEPSPNTHKMGGTNSTLSPRSSRHPSMSSVEETERRYEIICRDADLLRAYENRVYTDEEKRRLKELSFLFSPNPDADTVTPPKTPLPTSLPIASTMTMIEARGGSRTGSPKGSLKASPVGSPKTSPRGSPKA